MLLTVAVADRPKAALVPATLGWGREYFDEMYKDVKAKPTITEQAPETVTTRQPKQDAFSGQNMYTSRYLLHPFGYYMKSTWEKLL